MKTKEKPEETDKEIAKAIIDNALMLSRKEKHWDDCTQISESDREKIRKKIDFDKEIVCAEKPITILKAEEVTDEMVGKMLGEKPLSDWISSSGLGHQVIIVPRIKRAVKRLKEELKFTNLSQKNANRIINRIMGEFE